MFNVKCMEENEMDDLFDDVTPSEVTPEIEPVNDLEDLFETRVVENDNPTILDEFLKLKGLTNSSVKIIDENNEEKEVNFYDLSKEEQLEILNSGSEQPEEFNFSGEEKEFLGKLKDNNLSLSDYLENFKNQILAEVKNTSTQETYEIDSYTDEELFLLDLKSRLELSDEELVAELEKELTNKPMFDKKVDALRKEYKTLEENYKESERLAANQEKEEKFNAFANTLVEVARKTPEFHGIELEDEEKNEVLDYILDLDSSGVSKFYKELNTPEKLYEAAWFLKYGKGAFDALRDFYEAEISTLKKDNSRKVVINQPKNE